MGLTLTCSDLDPKSNCPYIARGETLDELQADLNQHAKTIHSYTDEQLTDPKIIAAIKASVKEE